MPIITPAYPSMCATHNIGRSSMAVIQHEFQNGVRLTDEIMVGRRPWRDLFSKHTFFTADYKYYLTIVSSSKTKEAQNAWSGFVESRVRLLVQKLEMHPAIALARPFNKGYDRVHRCRDYIEIDEVQSGSLKHLYKPPANGIATHGESEFDVPLPIKPEPKPDVQPQVKPQVSKPEVTNGGDANHRRVKEEAGEHGEHEPDLASIPMAPVVKDEPLPIKGEVNDNGTGAGSSGGGGGDGGGDDEVKLENIPVYEPEKTEIYTTNFYIGLQLAGKAKSLDLSREVNDWKAMLTSNDIYKEALNSLTIQNLRDSDLPDDVFEPGEVKPQRLVKRKRVPEEETKPVAKRQQPNPVASQQ